MVCKKLEVKWELWRKEQKLNTCRARLGAEIVRLNKAETPDIFQQPKVKELLKTAFGIEDAIAKIKKGMETPKPKRKKANGNSQEKTEKKNIN
jgi:hypothetical protein